MTIELTDEEIEVQKEIVALKRRLYALICGDYIKAPTVPDFVGTTIEIKPYEKKIKKGYVYLLQPIYGGAIKIGFSERPCRYGRFDEIQAMCPDELIIIDELDNVSNETETEFHRKYKDFRLHGEWFDGKIKSLILQDFNDYRRGEK